MHLFCSLIRKTFNHRNYGVPVITLIFGKKVKGEETTTNQTNQELKDLVIPLT